MTIFEIASHYPLTAGFGPRSYKGASGGLISDYHYGVDYATPVGVALHAHEDCRLVLSGFYDADHAGYIVMEALDGSHNWLLAHLSEALYKPGSTVKAGTLIGKTGATGDVTGPHIHIEYATGRFQGSITNNHIAGTTRDPAPYLRGGSPMISAQDVRIFYKLFQPGVALTDAQLQAHADTYNSLDETGKEQWLKSFVDVGDYYLSQFTALKTYHQARIDAGYGNNQDGSPYSADKFAQDRLNGGATFKKVITGDMKSYLTALDIYEHSDAPAPVDPQLQADAEKFRTIKKALS